MIRYDNKYPLISLHIPKTAGVSFGKILTEWFQRSYYPHGYNETPKQIPTHNLIFRRKNICAHGHYQGLALSDFSRLYGNKFQFVATLRNPLDQHISLFYYQKMLLEKGELFFRGERLDSVMYVNAATNEIYPTNDLEEFVGKSKSTMMSFLPANINRTNWADLIGGMFVYVAIYEDFAASVNELAKILNKPLPDVLPHLNDNKEKQNASIGSDAKKMFLEKNKDIFDLYQYCLDNRNPVNKKQ